MNRFPLVTRPLLLVALAALASSAAAPAGAFTLLDHRVAKMSTGDAPPADGPSGTSTRPRYSVSDDGCWVVFTSDAKDLIAACNRHGILRYAPARGCPARDDNVLYFPLNTGFRFSTNACTASL